jgi:hypothetical protein
MGNHGREFAEHYQSGRLPQGVPCGLSPLAICDVVSDALKFQYFPVFDRAYGGCPFLVSVSTVRQNHLMLLFNDSSMPYYPGKMLSHAGM